MISLTLSRRHFLFLLQASETPTSSYAIKKKDEIERVAKANR
ncbi:hypothetical protein L3X38_038458 [Prunus dulcis]|uniref:Uncharacterized protein n=1 Tax=Prunus dulcis TaxID=3755 RepID=A0AAD4V517_PRUDU|nr:hypothetical protein L3X38_038458 [Prunus dulcis]